jgi:hypothetical protein
MLLLHLTEDGRVMGYIFTHVLHTSNAELVCSHQLNGQLAGNNKCLFVYQPHLTMDKS